jgi:hypothetical protein
LQFPKIDEDLVLNMANSRSILTLSASEISYDKAVTEANLKYFENKIGEKLYSPIVDEGDCKIKQVPIFRSTDQLMKHYAINTPISKIARCNPKTCFNKGECISQFTLDNIMHLKEEFWGSECFDAPSTSVRRGLILHILRNAYQKKTDTCEFPITNFDKNNKIICESAFSSLWAYQTIQIIAKHHNNGGILKNMCQRVTTQEDSIFHIHTRKFEPRFLVMTKSLEGLSLSIA